jgi:transposase-like protein
VKEIEISWNKASECPRCDSDDTTQGYMRYIGDEEDQYQYRCLNCDAEFGELIEKTDAPILKANSPKEKK